MAIGEQELSTRVRTLRESVVKDSFAELNWNKLRLHLDAISLSVNQLKQLRAHIRRHTPFICTHPREEFEERRNEFFRSLKEFIGLRLDCHAKQEIESEIGLLDTIERGYRGILAVLDKCAISQHSAPIRVSASISRACNDYQELKRRHDIALSNAKELDATSGLLIEDDDGNSISPDAILEGLSETVAMTLIMEAHRNDWFIDDIITLPSLPSVGDEERYQSGSTQVLALCWRQWQRVEKRRRYLDGDLLGFSGSDRPVGLPQQISTLYEYRPLEEGLSEREVYDFIANRRLKDRLIQTYFEMEIETTASAHTVGIANGASLPPENLVSVEELMSCTALSEILGYSIVTDTEQPCGIRLIEWVRGYIVLKEIVKDRGNSTKLSGASYAVFMSEAELMETLRTCGLEDDTARQFIAMTCIHRSSRDLFDCPIIKVSDSGYLIFGPGVANLNIPLALLSNLSTRRINLGRKGEAFEQSVRELFRSKNIDVYSFTAHRDEQEFEYDAVVAWGSYLFVFECKNRSLSGNDPAACYYFDLEVISQAKQVRRLANALEKHPDIIEKHLGRKYVGNKVIPCVIHSLPYARFGDDEGVYFIDFSILGRFFDQPYLRVKVPHRIGDAVVLHRTAVSKFWQGDSPMASDLMDQIRKPFQLELMMKHISLKPLQFPIGQSEMVIAPELVREQMSAKTVSEAMGADSDYVLGEIASIAEQVRMVRARLDEEEASGAKPNMQNGE